MSSLSVFNNSSTLYNPSSRKKLIVDVQDPFCLKVKWVKNFSCEDFDHIGAYLASQNVSHWPSHIDEKKACIKPLLENINNNLFKQQKIQKLTLPLLEDENSPLFFSSRSSGALRTLSNFYPSWIYCPKILEKLSSAPGVCFFDRCFPSTEHLYQLVKAHCYHILPEDEQSFQRLMSQSPLEIKTWVKNKIEKLEESENSLWESLKGPLMEILSKVKFQQNPSLKELLLSTAPYPLVEDTSDAYWGKGSDGQGENALGKLLTKLREEWLGLQTAQA